MTEGSTVAPETAQPASSLAYSVRRSNYLFLCFQDGSFVDLEALLKGRAEFKKIKQVYAVSVLCSELYPITLEELRLLYETPSDEWIGAQTFWRATTHTPALRWSMGFVARACCSATETSPRSWSCADGTFSSRPNGTYLRCSSIS